MPKLKQDIFAVPDGEIHPKLFRAGEEVTGRVAAAAAEQGKIEQQPPVAVNDTPRKRGRPPKNKALTAPENK